MTSAPVITPSIIPQPVKLQTLDGNWELKEDAVIVYADDRAKPVAELLAIQLRQASGFDLPVRNGLMGDIVFQYLENCDLGEEGYKLCVTNYVSIVAPANAGLFYGAQTLRQLLPAEIYSKKRTLVEWKAPAVEICDMPRFRWRGMHLDVSRHFLPKKDVLHFIDIFASLKFNIFHWHLTDDQGWRIEIKKYPKLTEVGAWRQGTLRGHLFDKPRSYNGTPHGGFYTQDEIREVVEYAALRHVTIVPEIDMPGHMQAAIAAYPELGSSEDFVEVKKEWGVSKHILSPEDFSVQFCKDVLGEVLELFPSEFIHIGGDEVETEQWELSGHIQQLCEERGLKNVCEMQRWFVEQINDFLMVNGRRLIGWDEIAENKLGENIAIMWWRDWLGVSAVKRAVESGCDVVMTPSKYLYFDACQSENKEGEPLSIGHFLSLEKVYSFEFLADDMTLSEKMHILGAQGQLWTEYMSSCMQVEYMAFPRTCALAEIVWYPFGKRDYEDFLQRLRVYLKRLEYAGVNFRKLD